MIYKFVRNCSNGGKSIENPMRLFIIYFSSVRKNSPSLAAWWNVCTLAALINLKINSKFYVQNQWAFPIFAVIPFSMHEIQLSKVSAMRSLKSNGNENALSETKKKQKKKRRKCPFAFISCWMRVDGIDVNWINYRWSRNE